MIKSGRGGQRSCLRLNVQATSNASSKTLNQADTGTHECLTHIFVPAVCRNRACLRSTSMTDSGTEGNLVKDDEGRDNQVTQPPKPK